ncbi:MAG: dicarboxylate/amino acid:cation symporter [Planctomycetes bacterium]|nr:dicarboxylate/amino acid:cation symporter [Planctomycetota bacterium]
MAIAFVVGAAAGLAAHAWQDAALAGLPAGAPAPLAQRVVAAAVTWVSGPLGTVFLNLLMMLVIPLVFSALVLGIGGLGDLRALGRIGLRLLAYTVLVSGIAVALGVTLVNWLQPGEGVPIEVRERLLAGLQEQAAAPAPRMGLELIVGIVPRNPVAAMAGGDMLAVMFFALLFGIGLKLTRTAPAQRLLEVIEGLYDVTMRLIGMVIALAPIGVAALLFTLTAEVGLDVLLQLSRYVGVVVLALALHQFVVYSLAVRLLGGLSPLAFFRAIREAMLTAFATASSNATLPTALRVAEEQLRLPRHVSRFVLTIGSTANQNGTALFEGVTVLFLAQFFGVDLSLGQQLTVCGVCVLGGIGTAGVPAGSLPVVAMILGMVGVPAAGIGLVLGVDRFLDMCRTTLNVSGDLAAAVVIARSEAPQARRNGSEVAASTSSE